MSLLLETGKLPDDFDSTGNDVIGGETAVESSGWCWVLNALIIFSPFFFFLLLRLVAAASKTCFAFSASFASHAD